MTVLNEDIKHKLDELIKDADYLIANPDSLDKLPIKSTFTSNEDFLDKLFEKKKEISKELIKKLTPLDHTIANSTLAALYEELRETFVLGIFGAAITLALILIELGFKYRLYEERLKSDPNAKWEDMERIDFTSTINGLFRAKIITEKEKASLDEFNVDTRNPYIHYNIQKLVKGMILGKLPAIDLATGKVTIHENIEASTMPLTWFSAKKVRDRETAAELVEICVSWVNKILQKTK